MIECNVRSLRNYTLGIYKLAKFLSPTTPETAYHCMYEASQEARKSYTNVPAVSATSQTSLNLGNCRELQACNAARGRCVSNHLQHYARDHEMPMNALLKIKTVLQVITNSVLA